MSKVISFINNKGGASKTTLAFNVAKNYIRNSRSVICIDFDQQLNIKEMLPEHTVSGVDATELNGMECDYTIVDTGPTLTQDHFELILESDIVVIPFLLEKLDLNQTTKLLKLVKSLNCNGKAKLLPIHSGKNTIMYKNVYPLMERIAETFEIEILSSMSRNQSVSQANWETKTVFEIQSSPNSRQEFKTLFKEINQCLVRN